MRASLHDEAMTCVPAESIEREPRISSVRVCDENVWDGLDDGFISRRNVRALRFASMALK